jgi:hypothetical protein
MKKFTMVLLSVAFVTLIVGSMGFVAADHLDPGQGIYVSHGEVNLVVSTDTKFQVYLQAVIRNEDGQLINVTESTATGAYIPHKITDDVFDNLMGEKEIVTIDNIKYEKVQYAYTPTLEQRFIGLYPIYTEIALEFTYEEGTLAKMQRDKDYSLWKIHHCATFKGHNYDCIPVFQVLVPTMTLQPGDVLTQQWTILRALN